LAIQYGLNNGEVLALPIRSPRQSLCVFKKEPARSFVYPLRRPVSLGIRLDLPAPQASIGFQRLFGAIIIRNAITLKRYTAKMPAHATERRRASAGIAKRPRTAAALAYCEEAEANSTPRYAFRPVSAQNQSLRSCL